MATGYQNIDKLEDQVGHAEVKTVCELFGRQYLNMKIGSFIFVEWKKDLVDMLGGIKTT